MWMFSLILSLILMLLLIMELMTSGSLRVSMEILTLTAGKTPGL